MKHIVVDSSVIIDYLRSGNTLLPHLLEAQAKQGVRLLIPSIIVTEVWAGKSLDNPHTEKLVSALFQHFTLVDLNAEIAHLAGVLIRKSLVQGFDALIAATTLASNAHLATLNHKHFQHIPGLKLYSIGQ